MTDPNKKDDEKMDDKRHDNNKEGNANEDIPNDDDLTDESDQGVFSETVKTTKRTHRDVLNKAIHAGTTKKMGEEKEQARAEKATLLSRNVKNTFSKHTVKKKPDQKGEEKKEPKEEGKDEVLQVVDEPGADAEVHSDNSSDQGDLQEIVDSGKPEEFLERVGKDERKFKSKAYVRGIPYTLGNFIEYNHVFYKSTPAMARLTVELLFVCAILIPLPLACVIFKYWGRLGHGFGETFDKTVYNDTPKHARFTVFFLAAYAIYALSKILVENVLFYILQTLKYFEVSIDSKVASVIQIIRHSRQVLANIAVSLLVFFASVGLLNNYEYFSNVLSVVHMIQTLLLWLVFYWCLALVHTVTMSYFTAELRKKNFRNRIWDVNYKSFVIKKLCMMAEAHASGNIALKRYVRGYENEYDTGSFVRQRDLVLDSTDDARDLAEGIFGMLGVHVLEYKLIRKYFREAPENVYAYLKQAALPTGKDGVEPVIEPIEFEKMERAVVDLYQERIDIARSLYDRDNILRKLGLVLRLAITGVSCMIFLWLLNVRPQVYFASIGPLVLGFGWIFQDSIKEIYKCFVFLLLSHPFDCGDRLNIDGIDYTVYKIDLLYSTFIDTAGSKVYLPNLQLMSHNIRNYRRSEPQSEAYVRLVDIDTRAGKLAEIATHLRTALKKQANDYAEECTIIRVAPDSGWLACTFRVQYTSNLQDVNAVLKRRNFVNAELERILDDEGIKHLAVNINVFQQVA